ncbi:DUF3829 domain-containing protein [Terriglobus sp.]|uniref:DUF3829 domain-containing protein n=1 Tax=Terriglobus sp. TaxID=1889013 RepID=UPI003B00A3ED
MNFVRGIALLTCCSALLVNGCRQPGTASSSRKNPLGLSSEDRARQAKLQPVIDCINNAFSHFQGLQPFYQRRLVAITSHAHEGPAPMNISFKVAPFERNGEFSRSCAAGLTKAASMPPAIPEIDGTAKDAAQALLGLIQPGADMEAYLTQQAYRNDTNFERAHQLDEVISPLLNRVAQDANTLQAAVHQQETGLRQRELDAIEKKYGRNLTWHTRHCMMAARAMNDDLVQLAHSGRLTQQSVAEVEKPLQDAYDQGSAWVREHPNAENTGSTNPTPLWFDIRDYLSTELGDANELRQSLASPGVDPATVRTRISGINSDFNQMVSTYNVMQQNKPAID